MLTPAVLGAAGFLQDLGSREGDFISQGVHGAICSMQPCPQPLLCPPLAWAHRTDPGWGHVLWAQLRVAVLRSACPLGFVVGLKQRLGWHFRAGLTHGSSLAGGWQQGWGTAATFPGTNRAVPGAPVWHSLWSHQAPMVSEQPGRGLDMEPVVSACCQPHRALWLVVFGQKAPQQRRKMLLAGSLPAGFNLEVTFLWQYSTSGLTGCILCPHKVQGKARELLA